MFHSCHYLQTLSISEESANHWNVQFMQDLTIAKGDLVVVGDLNLHLDIHNDPGTQKFGELMTTLGLEQSVTGPTHRCGHTLDVYHAKMTILLRTLMSLILFQITLLLHAHFVLGSLLFQELLLLHANIDPLTVPI